MPPGHTQRATTDRATADRATIDRAITHIAVRQHGLVTRAQLLEIGMTPDTIRSRVRMRRLDPVQRGVYQVGPIPGPRMREMAAVLACGPRAVLSHRSAAVLWRLHTDQGAAASVDITVPFAEPRHRIGVRTHRMRGAIRPEDVTVLEGVPITTVARTVFDCAGQAGAGEMRQMLALVARGHADAQTAILQLIERHPNRKGVAILRAILNDDAQPELTRSEAEERVLTLIRKSRLPRPEVNVWLGEFEVDFFWRAERIVVEVDGFAFHGTRASFERDRRRDAVLAARGYRVIRVTWRQIVREPEAVLAYLAQALGAAAAAG